MITKIDLRLKGLQAWEAEMAKTPKSPEAGARNPSERQFLFREDTALFQGRLSEGEHPSRGANAWIAHGGPNGASAPWWAGNPDFSASEAYSCPEGNQTPVSGVR